MYDVALTVRACLASGTRVDVAWPVGADGIDVSVDEAVALTPGGGRVGTLLRGALDKALVERAAAGSNRRVELELGQVDAFVAGLAHGGNVTCLVVEADRLPGDLWDRLLARQPVGVVVHLRGDEVTGAELVEATGESSAVVLEDGKVTTILVPVTKLVVAGGGPIADALVRAAELLGWRVVVTDDPGEAVAEVSALSALDNLVVVGHDDRLTGSALEAALAGTVGYVGSIGPRRLQESRADWLLRRGVEDLERIHGPAGLEIGARTPGEIAVSVLAQALAVRA